MGNDKAFLAFEERLRTHRCRLSTTADWSTLDMNPNSTESMLMTESIYEVHTQLLGNSSRPGKDQSGANKGANEKCHAWASNGKCSRGATCKFSHDGTGGKPKTQTQAAPTTHVPQAFTQQHGTIKPKICMRYAYFGTCNRATGADCKDGGGNVQLHTCVHCKFKKGKHTLKDGKHPSGTCP